MTLQEELQDVQMKLYTERSNPNRDVQMIHDLEHRESDILEQISNEQYQERMQQEATDFSSIIDSLTFDGMTIRDIIANEDIYQAVSITFKKAFDVKTDDFISTLKTNQANAEKEKLDLIAQLEEQKQINEQSQTQIEQLKDYVFDLQTQIAIGVSGAIKVVTEDAKTIADRIRQTKIKIYDRIGFDTFGSQVKDSQASTFTAKLASTDENISFGYLEAGKYLVLTDDELSQFREETHQTEVVSLIPAVIELKPITAVEQFHNLSETNTDTEVQGYNGTSATYTEVTREEIEAIKAKIINIELDMEQLKKVQIAA